MQSYNSYNKIVNILYLYNLYNDKIKNITYFHYSFNNKYYVGVYSIQIIMNKLQVCPIIQCNIECNYEIKCMQ